VRFDQADANANAAAHGELQRAARELGAEVEALATVGSAPDGSWPEPGLLLAGTNRAAAVATAMGRRVIPTPLRIFHMGYHEWNALRGV
jgi:hypothetical protein